MKNLALARLQAISKTAKFPHSWIFSGYDLDVQLQTAQQFSNWLICAEPQHDLACGTCKGCLLFTVGTHPDICNITLQDDDTAIVVDAIRAANDFVYAKPQIASVKIVIIFPADKMNLQAANALLKTLEEPADNTIIFLLTKHVAMLLPTIISRCTKLSFNAENAPDSTKTAQIQQIITDLHNLWVNKQSTAIQTADLWVKRGADEVLYWLELVLADLLVTTYTRDYNLTKFTVWYKDQNALIQAVGVNKLWLMLQKIQQAHYRLGIGNRPNLQLLIEDIMLT